MFDVVLFKMFYVAYTFECFFAVIHLTFFHDHEIRALLNCGIHNFFVMIRLPSNIV